MTNTIQDQKRKEFIVNVIGTVAAIVSSVSLMPQLFDVFTTKNVDGVSFGTLLLIFITATLWTIYHYYNNTFQGMISGSFNAIQALVLMALVINYRDKNADYVPLG